MKEILKRAKSFITFDFPLQTDHISARFNSIHSNYQQQFPHWSFTATRKKLIADFWFRQVLFHYTVLITFTILASSAFGRTWHLSLLSVFIAASVSLITLILFNYWPAYYTDFLPKLDTIIAENEKLNGAANEIKKCKRTQFSISALTIIFYTFCKIGNIPILPSNDHSAGLLNNLYGADKDKLKQNLSRLYKLSNLSPKERAEIQKGIDTSRTFFELLDCSPAKKILDQLEVKLRRE
ncbi:MAG: hypothetical protein JWP81_1548 [Ferruginibacter sp.]|nr:hypothetical protein [Ferruginibacter sp.]